MKVEGRGDSESRGRERRDSERKKGDERRKLFSDIIKYIFVKEFTIQSTYQLFRIIEVK